MSHELKTPLNAILGFSDLMRSMADSLKPDQVREYAGLVHLGGTNLLKLLNQIMDLTKIAAGRYDLRTGAVDAGSLAWLGRERHVPRATEKSITLDADACPVGLMAQADEGVLAAMIDHLLDNAVAFTHPGGEIRLAVTRHGASIVLTVADNGPGVDPADLARIQQPFEHVARGHEHAKGAGLGLTMVKAFAELHGGALELASAHGQGFTATVTLPAA
jgi:cell cycle sensor histidine kinase DivJ